MAFRGHGHFPELDGFAAPALTDSRVSWESVATRRKLGLDYKRWFSERAELQLQRERARGQYVRSASPNDRPSQPRTTSDISCRISCQLSGMWAWCTHIQLTEITTKDRIPTPVAGNMGVGASCPTAWDRNEISDKWSTSESVSLDYRYELRSKRLVSRNRQTTE